MDGFAVGFAIGNRAYDIVNGGGHEDGKGTFHQFYSALNGKVELTDPGWMVLDPVDELKLSPHHSVRDFSQKT